MYLPPQGKEIDDDACLSQVNSLKEPGFHLECAVHREEAQNQFLEVTVIKVATRFKYFLSVRNSTILLTKIHLSSKVKYFLTRFDHNYFRNCAQRVFRNLAPRLTIDDGPISTRFACF